MTWTKTKTAVVGVGVIEIIGAIVFVARTPARKTTTEKIAASVAEIKKANVGLPELQIQAKTILFAAIIQKRIPDSANWCETLNAGGKLWPSTPTNTIFALNSKMAGRAYSPRSMPGNVVVFFETSAPGWNQAGGPELLARKPEGVAVAFADGRALVVPPGEIAQLRWVP